jgi:antitoxin (DNA-binding transcriptional repressor) of toxin-antitoxin stability system
MTDSVIWSMEGKIMQVNVMEAKTDFSRLICLLESKREDSIIVTRDGRPVVKITLLDDSPVSRRIGIARGKFRAPEDFDANNDEAAAMLMEGIL